LQALRKGFSRSLPPENGGGMLAARAPSRPRDSQPNRPVCFASNILPPPSGLHFAFLGSLS
jgi:hypothetical protein